MQRGLELGFSSVEDEHAGHEPPVEGTLPDWLDGALLRNGPAKFEVGGERVAHWFDGLGMLTRYGFDGAADRVTYTNRFLRSETYTTAVEEGRLDSQFASGDGGWLKRVWNMVAGEPTDNCNVHVARFGDQWVALTEVPRYVAFDPATLETVGEFTFDDDLSGTVNCAHVVPDPHREETVGLLVDYRDRAYRLYRVPDGSRTRELVAELDAGKPSYLHSFALTDDHVVLTDHPYGVDPKSFLLPGGDAFVDFFDWEPERGTTFRVVDRETGREVATATAAPRFVFHHVNAFVDGDAVVVDLVDYPDPEVVSGLYLDDVVEWFRADVDGELRRYRVPLDGGRPEVTSLYEGIELPRVAARDRTRPHRYVYGQGAADADGNHVAKVDCETGEVSRWEAEGLFVEEPVFVRAPDAAPPSDEGVVLATALNTTEGRTDLLVLDGETLDERARAPLPHAVPFGFHGRFRSAP